MNETKIVNYFIKEFPKEAINNKILVAYYDYYSSKIKSHHAKNKRKILKLSTKELKNVMSKIKRNYQLR